MYADSKVQRSLELAFANTTTKRAKQLIAMTQDFSHLGENSMFCLFAAGLHDSILKFASKYNNLFNLGSVKDVFLSKNKGTENFPIYLW